MLWQCLITFVCVCVSVRSSQTAFSFMMRVLSIQLASAALVCLPVWRVRTSSVYTHVRLKMEALALRYAKYQSNAVSTWGQITSTCRQNPHLLTAASLLQEPNVWFYNQESCQTHMCVCMGSSHIPLGNLGKFRRKKASRPLSIFRK